MPHCNRNMVEAWWLVVLDFREVLSGDSEVACSCTQQSALRGAVLAGGVYTADPVQRNP